MQAKQSTQCLAQKWLSAAAAAYPQTTSEEDGVTYVTGHQSSCIPANQDDGLVGEMAVNLGGERKQRVRQEPRPGAECRRAVGSWRRAASPPALCFSRPRPCAPDTAALPLHSHCSAGGWRQGWPKGKREAARPWAQSPIILSPVCLASPKPSNPG